jgi:hypothetical protein
MPKFRVRWEHREIGDYEQVVGAKDIDGAEAKVRYRSKNAECLNFDADDCDFVTEVWWEPDQIWVDAWEEDILEVVANLRPYQVKGFEGVFWSAEADLWHARDDIFSLLDCVYHFGELPYEDINPWPEDVDWRTEKNGKDYLTLPVDDTVRIV